MPINEYLDEFKALRTSSYHQIKHKRRGGMQYQHKKNNRNGLLAKRIHPISMYIYIWIHHPSRKLLGSGYYP